MDNNNLESTANISSDSYSRPIFFKKKYILILFIVFLTTILLILFKTNALHGLTSKDVKKNVAASIINNVPEKNLIVFTRCFGGQRQPSNCKLYMSSLNNPTEQVVYDFKFPKIKQTEYETGFLINIIGVVDNKAIYTKEYWKKIDKVQTEYKILGSIDLATGENSVIYQQERSNLKNSEFTYFYGVYIDKINGTVYYSTTNGPESPSNIYGYKLKVKQNKKIISSQNTEHAYEVKYANKNKLYLSYVTNFLSGDYLLEKIFDLNTQSMSDAPILWENGVVNPQGTKVAYLVEKEISSGRSALSISLLLSDLDGGNITEIYKIPYTLNAGDGYDGSYPYSVIGSDFNFSKNGNILSYSIFNTKFENGKYEPVKTNFITFFMSSERYIEEVVPSDQEYLWVDYLSYNTPLDNELTQGIIYNSDGAWFLVRFDGYGEKTLDLNNSRQAILANAQNVILFP